MAPPAPPPPRPAPPCPPGCGPGGGGASVAASGGECAGRRGRARPTERPRSVRCARGPPGPARDCAAGGAGQILLPAARAEPRSSAPAAPGAPPGAKPPPRAGQRLVPIPVPSHPSPAGAPAAVRTSRQGRGLTGIHRLSSLGLWGRIFLAVFSGFWWVSLCPAHALDRKSPVCSSSFLLKWGETVEIGHL